MVNGNFLLFDAQCPQCTRVAKRLRELQIDDLEVRSLHDSRIVELFLSAERPVPDKPALVQATAHGLTVHTGLLMRLRLARMLGVRRAADIVGLMAAEAKAHVARRGDDDEGRMSRRRMLGGTAAAGAGALIFGAGMASPAAAGETPQAGTPLDAASKQRLLTSTTVQRAHRIWGEIDESAITAGKASDGTTVALVPHRGEMEALTAVSLDSDDTPAITITPTPDRDGLRYFMADSGTPLAEQTIRNGQVSTTELDISVAPPGAEPAPDGIREFAICFAICAGANISGSCLEWCIACATGNIVVKAVNCPLCAGCAREAVRCANSCRSAL